ncbi:MAG: YecH family protein [Planctomycetes bacterium]|nr:YecH family protein [Planctomycetota bacterium]
MTDSFHGHEVLHFVHESNPPLTRATFATAVAERFGENATFHTCSAAALTPEALLQFLSERGKVVEEDGVLRTDLGRMCP